MHDNARIAALLVLLAAVCTVPAAAAAVGDDSAGDVLTVARFLDLERVSDPRISPDGSQVVYTRSWVNRLADRWESGLWIMDADGGRHRFLARGSGARWSPDGRRIAYLAEGEPRGSQIFVRWMDSGQSTQVTRVLKGPSSLRWSPDGSRIAFVMLTPPEQAWEIDMPEPPEGAEWTRPPRIVEGVYFRQDRRGFLEEGFTHLFVVPSEGGTPRQLTEGTWNVGARTYGLVGQTGLDWTPDGGEIVFDGLITDDRSRLYRRSHLYAVDVKTGKIRRLTDREGPWTGPVVSPDGRSVAFTGYDWTSQTYRASELHVIGIDGEKQRRISGDLDRDPENVHWAPDGGSVYFTAKDHGGSDLYRADPGGGPVRRVTEGNHVLSLGSVSDEGLAVGILSGPHRPGDVVRVPLPDGDPVVRLTGVNDDVLERIDLGEVEEIRYESPDSTPVQGWIVKPPRFDPERKYPLILHIHGGPHSMYSVRFNPSFQILAAAGYLVLYPNPRGSTGYGTAFGNAIDNSYPGVDYHDLMAGVDAVIERGYVDGNRLYVTGVSGGGVLSSWTIAHTNRFAAAAVRAPVIDWISFAGTTDITEWAYYRYDGYPWENPDRWLQHSPLMHVGKVKTPVLLMTGELDLRTPMGQTEEYFQALNAVGVPARLVRFHGEYHGTGSLPSNFMRTQLYLIDWFEEHTGDREEPEAGLSGVPAAPGNPGGLTNVCTTRRGRW